MKRLLILIVSILGFLVLIIQIPVLAIFPLFLMVWSLRNRIQMRGTHFSITYIVVGTLCGCITEGLAILDNLDKPPQEKILFHPDPGIDLLLGVGFYFFIALVWAVLFKRYAISWKAILVIGGIWGIFAEQNGAVLLSISTLGVIPALLAYGFVFLVYGPFMAIPALFFEKEMKIMKRKKMKFIHGLLAFGALWGAYILAGVYMWCIGMIMGFPL
jgi:hypothetical protein